MASYDIIGNIGLIKGEGRSKKQKTAQAKELLKKPGIKTVLEKIGNVRGRLRTINVGHIAGVKNLIAGHIESGCIFKFNIKTCYFSPRLSNERKEIANKIKKKDNVLVMFAGVGVYPIVMYHYSKPKKIVGVEIGRDCCKYFKENIKLNKIPENRIKVIQGDVKRKIEKGFGKFDVVVMARPNLKESFLEWGLKASKKGTKIFYYGFCNRDELSDLKKNLIEEARKLKRKIKILRVVKAGDIAPYKFRYRIEIKIL